MVVDSSDYRVPQFGRFDPTSLSTYGKVAGLLVGASIVLWTVLVAQRQGVPLIDSLVSRLPVVGSRLQAGGAGPRRFGR